MVSCSGCPEALAVKPEMTEVMFRAFVELMDYWEADGRKQRADG